MKSCKKYQVQALNIGMVMFLALSFFASGQPPPDPPVTSGNQPPQIVSIEVSSEGNNYTIRIGIQDEDSPDSITVSVQHEDGTTKETKYTESRYLEGRNIPILMFVATFTLKPGSHTFTISVEDYKKAEPKRR